MKMKNLGLLEIPFNLKIKIESWNLRKKRKNVGRGKSMKEEKLKGGI